MNTPRKYREQKSCPCSHCRDGSKRHEKVASHRVFRKRARLAVTRYQSGAGDDYECGPHGAGYWD